MSFGFKEGRNSRHGDLYGGICNNPGINRKTQCRSNICRQLYEIMWILALCWSLENIFLVEEILSCDVKGSRQRYRLRREKEAF